MTEIPVLSSPTVYPMLLGLVGTHINKVKHISCGPVFQSYLYYVMQTIMPVC